MSVLVADIGGTNTRCALASADKGVGPVTAHANAGHDDLATLLGSYIGGLPAASRPRQALLAIAAPIRGDEVQMPNIDWAFSRSGLRTALELDEVVLVNDFAALARALPELGPGSLVAAGGGEARPDAPKVVLGPGTGLGVASLVPAGKSWLVLPGEGGHVTLGGTDETDAALTRFARQRYGHCSAERLLSGAGLALIHEALHAGESLTPAEIGERADAGDAGAAETLERFFCLLGTMAGNLALTLGAFGGVYIGGGIVPRYLPALRKSGFRQRFEGKGRYREYLRDIPVWVIVDEYPALKGLLATARDRGLA